MKQSKDKMIAKGNQTLPYQWGYPIYGAYNMQAISYGEGTCNGGVPLVPLENVEDARAFVNENHK